MMTALHLFLLIELVSASIMWWAFATARAA